MALCCELPVSPRNNSPGDEARNRNQVFHSPFSCVQLALSSKITSILFSTQKNTWPAHIAEIRWESAK